MRRTLFGLALLVGLAAAVLPPATAQQARYSVNGGATSCTTVPSLYRLGDTDTGYGINSTPEICASINGAQVESTSATRKLIPIGLQLGGTSSSFPMLLRNAAVVDVKLADNSAYTNLAVVDDAFAAGWNGSQNVPTKNAIFDAAFVTSTTTGKKIVGGQQALDGSNPTTVATGLTTAEACTASIQLTTAPGTGTSVITVSAGAGSSLNLYAWKVTAAGDATLIASTGTESINWICTGV